MEEMRIKIPREKQARDLFFIFAEEWERTRQQEISFSLDTLCQALRISGDEDEQVRRLHALAGEVVQGAIATNQEGQPPLFAFLVPFIGIDKNRKTLRAECLDAGKFMNAVIETLRTEKRAALSIPVRGRYARKLFLVLFNSEKEKLTIKPDALKDALGAPEKTRTADLMKIVKRAVDDLRASGIFTTVKYVTTIDQEATGRPIISLTFTFKFRSEVILELHGQERLV